MLPSTAVASRQYWHLHTMADQPWLGCFFPPQKHKIAKKLLERHVGPPTGVILTILQQPTTPPTTPLDNGTANGHRGLFHWRCPDGSPPNVPPHCQSAHPSFHRPPTPPRRPRLIARRQHQQGTLDGQNRLFHWCCPDGNPPEVPPHCQPDHPSFCGPPTLPIGHRPTVSRQR